LKRIFTVKVFVLNDLFEKDFFQIGLVEKDLFEKEDLIENTLTRQHNVRPWQPRAH